MPIVAHGRFEPGDRVDQHFGFRRAVALEIACKEPSAAAGFADRALDGVIVGGKRRDR